VLSLFRLNNNLGVFVNRGWIPPEKRAEFEKTHDKAQQNTPMPITGILKKGEQLEMRSNQKNHLRQSGENHFIDLETMKTQSGLEEPISDLLYIEEFIQADDTLANLYPYPSSKRNYVKPYLTPQKHLEYASFWGLTSAVGLFAMKYVLKKWA
jgi:cytochrome oxidase assembly protein ShyY1